MTTETMTLRQALSTKKLLDKQIQDYSNKGYLAVCTNLDEFIDGTPIEVWKQGVISSIQSLNDKIIRREAISKAIMEANLKHTVKLPKVVLFGPTGEDTEELSFASAIARKAYYNDVLARLCSKLENDVNQTVQKFKNSQKEAEMKVTNRMTSEFAGVNNVSSKTKEEREQKLRDMYSPKLLDPYAFCTEVDKVKTKIEEYILAVDIELGRATEVTSVTITY